MRPLRLACLLWLPLAGSLLAQESPVIGLGDAERIAVENSFDLKLMGVEAAALEKGKQSKLRDFFPQVSVSYRQNRMVARRDYDNGDHSVQLQVSQPIYDGGKSVLAYEIARIDLRLLQERRRQTLNQVRLQARQQYLKIQQSLLSISVARANLDSMASLLKKSEAEHRLGLVTALDLEEVKNQYGQKSLALIKEQNAYRDTVKDFALFLRLPSEELPRLKVLDLGNIRVKDLTLKQNDLVQMALENRPDVRQARIDRMRAEQQHLIAERHYLPTISLTGHYGKTGEDWPPRTLEWGVGFNISVPIFGSTVRSDTSENRSKGDTQRSVSSGGSADIYNNAGWEEPILRSSMTVLQNKDKIAVLAKQVELKMERLARDYNDRRKSLDLADQSLAVREKRFQVEQKKYSTGQASLTELFQEQQRLIQARQALIQEKVDLALSVNQFEVEIGIDIDTLELIQYTEYDKADEETIRRSWTPKTSIDIPGPRLE